MNARPAGVRAAVHASACRRSDATAMAEPGGHRERLPRRREVRRDRERVAHRLRLARRERVRRDLRAELRDLVRVEDPPVIIDHQRAQHVRVLIGGDRPRGPAPRTPGEPPARSVISTSIQVSCTSSNAAGEAVPDQQISDHDVELEAGPGHDRRAVRGQVPGARLATGDDPGARDVDRRRALELGPGQPQLLGVAAHRGHPGVAADEPVRRDRAVLRAELGGRRGRALHVAVEASPAARP